MAVAGSTKDRTRTLGGLLAVPYPKLRKRVQKSLVDLLQRYDEGTLTFTDMKKQTRAILGNSYTAAYATGLKNDELVPADTDYIKSVRDSEFKYLGGYFEDLKAGDTQVPFEQRLGMYVNKLNSLFYTGMVKGSPKQTRWHWLLFPGENCDDCIALSEGGPYLGSRLPTVPGAGDTQCRSNCNCWLETD